MAKLKVTYNAPFTLSFALLAIIIFFIDDATRTTVGRGGVLENLILLKPPFSLKQPWDFAALIGHTLGHGSLMHLVGNLSFILLLGPIVEHRYGSKMLAYKVFFTAVATGLMHCFLFKTALWGASGIVFMLIVLTSFNNAKRGEIPLTFVLIVVLFIGKEVYNAFQPNQISEFAHIFGGGMGALFGFWSATKSETEIERIITGPNVMDASPDVPGPENKR